MAGLTDNFLLDPLLRQPFLRAKREDSHDNLLAPVAVTPSELDISSFGLIIVLCLMKSKGHSSPLTHKFEGASSLLNAERPRLAGFLRVAFPQATWRAHHAVIDPSRNARLCQNFVQVRQLNGSLGNEKPRRSEQSTGLRLWTCA
jgi:hypothetical protein